MYNIFSSLKNLKAKKLFLVISITFTICFCMISDNCLAMQMSQPVKIGETDGRPIRDADLLPAKGASYISKERLDRKSNKCVIAGGVARFGKEDDALWMHNLGSFKGEFRRVTFGGKDVKNTFYIGRSPSIEEESVNIFKISTDIGITLYAIGSFSDSNLDYIIVGYKDGKFVKYIDTYNITKQYFGTNRRFNYYGDSNKFFNDIPFKIQGDTIIMHYSTSSKNNAFPSEVSGAKMLRDGQFRFKWDDAAKWFSVKYESFN